MTLLALIAGYLAYSYVLKMAAVLFLETLANFYCRYELE
jgi:hypothetical protein